MLNGIVAAVGLIAALIAGYVTIQNKTILAEVRQELAEMENKIFARINGTYVRSGECTLRESFLSQKLAGLGEAVEALKDQCKR